MPEPDDGPRFGRRRALGLLATAGISAVAVSVVHARGVVGLGTLNRDLSGVSGPTTSGASAPSTSSPSASTPTSVDPVATNLATLGRVVVVGDSITYISSAAIRKALASVHHLSVDGRFGFTIEQLLPDAELLALTQPDAVVINLGTNDANLDLRTADSVRHLDAMLELFPTASRVLVTVNTHFGSTDTQARAAAINDHIRSRGVTVVDWDAAVGDEIAAGLPDGPVTSDTIHPTTFGQKLLAKLIAEGLSSTVQS